MEKNKVVVFDVPSGRAKVFVTHDPKLIKAEDHEIKIVNPDLSYVRDVPPELWHLGPNNMILPLMDADQITERLGDIKIKTFADKTDQYIKDSLVELTHIPEAVAALKLQTNESILDVRDSVHLARVEIVKSEEKQHKGFTHLEKFITWLIVIVIILFLFQVFVFFYNL